MPNLGDRISQVTAASGVNDNDLLILSQRYGDYYRSRAVRVGTFLTSLSGNYVRTTGDESIAGVKTFTDNVVILGDLSAVGTFTRLHTQDTFIKDNIITLNDGETASGVTLGSAGLAVDRGSLADAQLLWDEATDTWVVGLSGGTYYEVLDESWWAITSGTLPTGGDGVYLPLDGSDMMSGHVVASSAVYDLGSSSRPWRSLYVTSGSVYIDNRRITTTTRDGIPALSFNGYRVLDTRTSLLADLTDVFVPTELSATDSRKILTAQYDDKNYGAEGDGDLTLSGGTTVINSYTDLTADVTVGATTLTVRQTSGFSVGDTVMLHQTQNYRIDGTGPGGAGLYELVTIATVPGTTTVTLERGIANAYYSDSDGDKENNTKAQLVRVPEYGTLTLTASATVTADAWDGYSGGIVAFKAKTLSGDGFLDATAKGFRGGRNGTSDVVGEGCGGRNGGYSGGANGAGGSDAGGGGGHNGAGGASGGGGSYGRTNADVRYYLSFGGGGSSWDIYNHGGKSGGAVLAMVESFSGFSGRFISDGDGGYKNAGWSFSDWGGGSGGAVGVFSIEEFDGTYSVAGEVSPDGDGAAGYYLTETLKPGFVLSYKISENYSTAANGDVLTKFAVAQAISGSTAYQADIDYLSGVIDYVSGVIDYVSGQVASNDVVTYISGQVALNDSDISYLSGVIDYVSGQVGSAVLVSGGNGTYVTTFVSGDLLLEGSDYYYPLVHNLGSRVIPVTLANADYWSTQPDVRYTSELSAKVYVTNLMPLSGTWTVRAVRGGNAEVDISSELFVPAAAMTPGSGEVSAVTETLFGGSRNDYLEFAGVSGSSDGEGFFEFVFPSNWDRENISFRTIWKPSAGASQGDLVRWVMGVTTAADGETDPYSYTTTTHVDDAVATTGTVHVTSYSSGITLADVTTDELVKFVVYRPHSFGGVSGMFGNAALRGLQVRYTLQGATDTDDSLDQPVNITTTDYSLSAVNAGRSHYTQSVSATTVRIRASADHLIPVNSIYAVTQESSGVLTIAAQPGVTLNGIVSGSIAMFGQYEGATLIHRSLDSWLIQGGLSGSVA